MSTPWAALPNRPLQPPSGMDALDNAVACEGPLASKRQGVSGPYL